MNYAKKLLALILALTLALALGTGALADTITQTTNRNDHNHDRVGQRELYHHDHAARIRYRRAHLRRVSDLRRRPADRADDGWIDHHRHEQDAVEPHMGHRC